MIADRPTRPYGPFGEMYRTFFELAPRYSGYEFGHAPLIKCAPPTVVFPEPVKWYSWDRARRRAAIREVRDRYLEEILCLARSRREAGRLVGTGESPIVSIEQGQKREVARAA